MYHDNVCKRIENAIRLQFDLNYRDSRFSNFQVSCCVGQFQFAEGQNLFHFIIEPVKSSPVSTEMQKTQISTNQNARPLRNIIKMKIRVNQGCVSRSLVRFSLKKGGGGGGVLVFKLYLRHVLF